MTDAARAFPEAESQRLRAAIKTRDTWWAHWVIGPLANRVVGRIAPHAAITPNRVTVVSLVVGLVSAIALAWGESPGLQAGALLLQISFVLDCVDGQLSRFRGESTVFGAVLDRLCDRVKLFAVTFGLAAGLARTTGDRSWFALALVYFFAEVMIEHYVTVYRKLEEGGVLGHAPPSRIADGGLTALRALDLPIVRLGFADRYFLISAFTLVGASAACLRVLATLGVLQLLLRPLYLALALRARFGRWPWNDDRPHRLGQNF